MPFHHKDSRDVNWTAASETAANRLFAAMDAYFTFRADAVEQVDGVLAEDPQCPAAWILKGYLLLFARSVQLVEKARESYRHAAALAESAAPHERLHIGALKAWIEADTLGAQRIWDAILAEEPHDLLALRVQHFNAMFLGKPDYLGLLAGRALANWDDAIPGAGFVYGMACMGLEEVGDYRRAERLGRRGSELEPEDLWCVHSVAHVMEAEGRLAEGLSWMVRPDSYWENRGPMRHHLWWHEALFLYQNGAYERALDCYDHRLAMQGPSGYMELTNSASLLLRLETAGVPCGERWQKLARQNQHFIDGRVMTFTDIHALVVFAMAGDGQAFVELSSSISAYAAAGATYDAEASSRIGVPVARALKARVSGDQAAAAEILLCARLDFPKMGGSNAQRDVLDIYLIDCAIALGDRRLAKRLLDEYLDLRPESAPMRERLAALEAT